MNSSQLFGLIQSFYVKYVFLNHFIVVHIDGASEQMDHSIVFLIIQLFKELFQVFWIYSITLGKICNRKKLD